MKRLEEEEEEEGAGRPSGECPPSPDGLCAPGCRDLLTPKLSRGTGRREGYEVWGGVAP